MVRCLPRPAAGSGANRRPQIASSSSSTLDKEIFCLAMNIHVSNVTKRPGERLTTTSGARGPTSYHLAQP